MPRIVRIAIITTGILAQAQGITIKMDYRSDNGFLTNNPEARAAVEKAAADLSAVITTQLQKVPPEAAEITSSFRKTSYTTQRNYFYNDPNTRQTLKGFTPGIAPGLILIYAGGKSLGPHIAGKGAPGGVQVRKKGQGDPHDWPVVVKDNTNKANSMLRRGGPIIQILSGTTSLGTSQPSYRIETGLSIGSLWFNTDINNDGKPDSPQELANFWHYSHKTAVDPRKIDLYTVALHEIMHVLGVGTSNAWDKNLYNGLWAGTKARTTAGSNINLADGAHLSPNVKGLRIADNLSQPAVMGPATGPGQRKLLTNIDLAILKDLGWDIIPLRTLP